MLLIIRSTPIRKSSGRRAHNTNSLRSVSSSIELPELKPGDAHTGRPMLCITCRMVFHEFRVADMHIVYNAARTGTYDVVHSLCVGDCVVTDLTIFRRVRSMPCRKLVVARAAMAGNGIFNNEM